ncbi:MAG: YIP1 family protein [Candidatus Obscuribacterales bacterium]|jgi:hypothetical protein|nr:YIP1 family protein [Candidatus Obscuribacterales bacterium]
MSESVLPQEESPTSNATTAASEPLMHPLDIFIGTLLCPVQTFGKLAEDCRHEANHLPAAFGIVILIFALDALRLTPANSVQLALFNVPAEITGGLTLWLLSSAVVSLTAMCFGADMGKVRSCFVTMAWALLPWIFLGPIACFWKVFGSAHVLFMTIPLVWIFFLQLVAIKQSLQLKIWQVLVLALIVPTLLSWYQMMQFLEVVAAVIGSFF